MPDRCHITFLVPHHNGVQFTPYLSQCIRREGYGHYGNHVFLNPQGLPVQWDDTEGDFDEDTDGDGE